MDGVQRIFPLRPIRMNNCIHYFRSFIHSILWKVNWCACKIIAQWHRTSILLKYIFIILKIWNCKNQFLIILHLFLTCYSHLRKFLMNVSFEFSSTRPTILMSENLSHSYSFGNHNHQNHHSFSNCDDFWC